MMLLLICLLSLQIVLAKYLRGDIDIINVDIINNNVTIDEKFMSTSSEDIDELLHNLGFRLDHNRKVHSGTYNIVRFYNDENNNKIVLRESKEPLFGADKQWFSKEVNQTRLLSNLKVAPYLYKSGYNNKNQGYMISDRYEYSLYEFTKYRKHRKLYLRYENELRYQIHSVLKKMIFNASIYNSDTKIENIVIRFTNDDHLDLRFIDFDAFYSKTSFDLMHTFEYHYKIDISQKRVSIFRQAWYLLCLIFIEEHLRQYSRITLLKDDIVKAIAESDEEIILAMSYIYYSDFMELIRCGYYDDKNLYNLILDNVNTNFSIDLIRILQYSRPTAYSNYSQIN